MPRQYTPRVSRVCDWCGTIFSTPPNRLKSGRARFCTRACYKAAYVIPKAFLPLGPRPLAERFWEKVDKNGPLPDRRPELGPCWLWTAALNNQGYGRIKGGPDGKEMLAHRAALYLAGVEIGPGLDVDHLCRRPACVRPTHLDVVTHRENCARGDAPSALVHRLRRCMRGHEISHANSYFLSDGRYHSCRLCKGLEPRGMP